MDPIDVLARVVDRAHSSANADERLGAILKALAEGLDFDAATLYELDPVAKVFHPEHSNMGKGFVSGSGSFPLGQGIVGTCGEEKTLLRIEGWEGRDPTMARWGADFQGYATLVAIPVVDEQDLSGVLLLLQREPRRMSPEEMRVVDLVARGLAGVKASERLRQSLQNRAREMNALSEISRAAGSTLELEPLMDLFVQTAVRVMGAKGGALRVLDEESGMYRVTSVYGGDLHRAQEFRSGPDSDCEVVRTGQPFLVRNAKDRGACWGDMGPDITCCLCVPLSDQGNTLGVLSVYDKKSWLPGDKEGFTEQEIALIQTMAGFVASAMSKAIHHRRIERLVTDKEVMVRELSILYASSAAMMRTIEMERLFQVILVALTLGDGLGFNRAMLFVVNDADGVLEGKTGVGPANAAEAGQVWDEMGRTGWSLSQWLEWTLEQDRSRGEESVIHRVARTIRVPLNDERCVLIQALREKTAFCLDPRENPGGIGLLRPLEIGTECAIVPVMARGEPLGAILVDNIYSARPIQEKDLRFLSAFASQAGLAIQNALLYEGLRRAHKEMQNMQQRLIHSEKLAALGEFAATMAHEIRNPLVSIGGYARLVQKKHRDSYSQIIYEEVERLEGILNRVLAFSKVTPGDRKDEEIGALLEETLRTLRGDMDQKRVRIQKEWTQSLPAVHCDRDQIKQVFLNLMQNALEAMGSRGTLTLSTYLSSEEDGMWVVAEVADTGGGISSAVLQNIFNPFFTTKERGAGLGLAITRRIVEAHGGKIEVDNRPGEGSTFRVKLPPSF